MQFAAKLKDTNIVPYLNTMAPFLLAPAYGPVIPDMYIIVVRTLKK